MNRNNKAQPRARSLSSQCHGMYRYQDPYFSKKKEISLRNRKNELQRYHLPPSKDRGKVYQPPQPLLASRPPYQSPPPTPPYCKGYYDARILSEHRYRPFQGYEEETYPRNEEYHVYLQNQPSEREIREDGDLYKRPKK